MNQENLVYSTRHYSVFDNKNGTFSVYYTSAKRLIYSNVENYETAKTYVDKFEDDLPMGI